MYCLVTIRKWEDEMRTYYPTVAKRPAYPTGTLCFWCQHSVPDQRGHGCSWSKELQPVAGWIATPVRRMLGGKSFDTYCIHECPQFREEVISEERLLCMEGDV